MFLRGVHVALGLDQVLIQSGDWPDIVNGRSLAYLHSVAALMQAEEACLQRTELLLLQNMDLPQQEQTVGGDEDLDASLGQLED